MTVFFSLFKRNIKLFFKDKGMFVTSLITPLILLVLFMTFLGQVYHDSFSSALPAGLLEDDTLIDAIVGGQLVSSLLAVCCVTVAFCSNLLMVQDKVSGARRDLTITPVKNSVMALSYYSATLVSTLIICLVATAAGFAYLAHSGWYLSGSDVLLVLLDVLLLTLFGTALSSIINFFLSSQGQISAVSTIISAGYGFICGAYMPISQFSDGLQKVLSFLPCTHGTSLIRNHTMQGAFAKLEQQIPSEVVDILKDTVDCNIYLMGDKMTLSLMYAILGVTTAVMIFIYVLINILKKSR